MLASCLPVNYIREPMKIRLITPAPPGSRAGNRATASRWARFLRDNDHQVDISVDYQSEPADLMIALHAWRSAAAIRLYKQATPEKPLVLALTGTDIYKFQQSHPDICYASMDQADLLVGLHNLVAEDIPERYRSKLRIVLQSAEAGLSSATPDPASFDVCVIGHLRDEKDSLRAAFAVRDLPAASAVSVVQAGKAHNDQWVQWARLEETRNSRYQWRGEISQEETKTLMQKCRLMVMSSVMEGGANVVSEACVAGLPILASAIPGNIGLLGEDYPGYYPAKDTGALKKLLLRAEQEPAFVARIKKHCIARSAWFRPEKESAGINAVIDELSINQTNTIYASDRL